MRKIITFLGLKPQEISYQFPDGEIIKARVFPEALIQHKGIQFDQMLVFVTPQAEKDTFPILQEIGDERIKPVSIGLGTTKAEMWNFFDRALEKVEKGDTVIFDITHAIRTIPFLVFLFAAFLKTARQVKIEAIYYGALVLGGEAAAPVLDLSEFVEMLDWITATDQFVKTGQAAPLAGLLEERAKTHRKTAANRAAKTLQDVSRAAFLCQPFELMRTVGALDSALDAVESDFAPPFQMLSQQIVQEYVIFAAPDNITEPDELPRLRAEFRLLNWYAEKGQLIQAVTLAREWLIDAVTWKLGQPLDFHHEQRVDIMETAVSELSLVGQKRKRDNSEETYLFTAQMLNSYGQIIYDTWPERQQIIKVWNALRTVRNQLDHAQHQAGTMPLTTLEKKMKRDILPGLEELAHIWQIL